VDVRLDQGGGQQAAGGVDLLLTFSRLPQGGDPASLHGQVDQALGPGQACPADGKVDHAWSLVGPSSGPAAAAHA
jgi:hypothetical protein